MKHSCIVLEDALPGTDLAYAAATHLKRFANELHVDCEPVRCFTK